MNDAKNKPTEKHKRFMYFIMGLVVATSLTLMAFEWKTFKTVSTAPEAAPVHEFIEQDPIPVRVSKPAPAPPPPLAPPKPVPDDVVVKKDRPDDNTNQDEPDFNFDEPDINDTEELEKEDIPGPPTGIEKMPEFRGGDRELKKYISKTLTYPDFAKRSGIEGKVYLEFTVTKKGEITDIELLRGIGSGCDEEAVRVLKNMPLWYPGEQNGVKVAVRHRIAVLFKLK